MDGMRQLWRRLLLLVGRGRVQLVDDAGAAQLLQVRVGADWVQDKIPRLAEYGFQSVPPAGADAVLLFLAGNTSDAVAIATGHQTYRLRSLGAGEVAISDDKGQSVVLSAAGIRIDGGGLPMQITNTPSVTMDTPLLHCTGDFVADGDVKDQGGAKSMAGMRTAHNLHKAHGTPGTGNVPDHLM